MKARLPLPRTGGGLVEHHRFSRRQQNPTTRWMDTAANFASASLPSNFLETTADVCVHVHTHWAIRQKKITFQLLYNLLMRR